MAASTPRKTTRRSPAKDASTASDGVLRLSTAEGKARFVEREPLFYIDDVEYTIPKHVPANVSLQYMHISRTTGVDDAVIYAMNTLLGEDGYRALRQYEGLSDGELDQVVDAVLSKVIAGMYGPKGGRKNS